jgi:putative ATPase
LDTCIAQTLDGLLAGQNYFPDEFRKRPKFYDPERGFERELAKRLACWDSLRKKRGSSATSA